MIAAASHVTEVVLGLMLDLARAKVQLGQSRTEADALVAVIMATGASRNAKRDGRIREALHDALSQVERLQGQVEYAIDRLDDED